METENSLDNILADEPSEAPVTEQEPVAEEPQTEDRPRDENGRFAKKGEEGASPAPDDKNEYDGAATLAERRKRQEAEARIATLEQQLQQIQNPPAPAPDMFADPEQWQGHFGSQVTQTAAQWAAQNAKFDASEMMAGQSHEDFDEMKATFLELAGQNPQMLAEVKAHRHPWERAYEIAKNHRGIAELGATNLTELEAKLREKIAAELQGGGQQQLPPTLSTERNAGQRTGPAWSGPKPLDELLG